MSPARRDSRELQLASAAAALPEPYPFVDRLTFERREDAMLAPYAARSARSLGRAHAEEESAQRTAFQRDRDRIVHSTAFRRLEYKTQVFVNHEGDHYRTRLTHTLEVAQVSRSIARVLALNEDLVEAVALAHDLGHSPFGHAGEEVLNRLLAAHGGFNHNLQSLRVIDRLEQRYPAFEGLNLSWEIRESIIKHGSPSPGHVADEFRPEWGPLLEAQVADAADSLAYSNHDIDDGVRSRFLRLEDLRQVRLWRDAEAAVREATSQPERLDDRVLVARTVSCLIDTQVADLLATTRSRLKAAGVDSVDSLRRAGGGLVGYSEGMAAKKSEMDSLLTERLYRHYRTVTMAEKAKRFLEALFVELVRDPRQLPPSFQKRARTEGTERTVCDFLAGMTDRFCQDEYCRMFHPYEKI